MSLIFQTQFEKGSYIERWSGDAMTNVAGVIKRSSKGLAWYDPTGSANISPTIPALNRNACTIVANVRGFRNDSNDYFIFGNDGGTALGYLGEKNSTLRLESDTNTDFWLNITPDAAQLAEMQNKFYQLILVADGGTVRSYLNNVQIDVRTPSDNYTPDTISRLATGWSDFIQKIIIADHAFTEKERANAYRDFLNAGPRITEKYPKQLPEFKPTDLSRLVNSRIGIPGANVSEKIVNGTFDDASNWSIPAGGWSIANGKATYDDSGVLYMEQSSQTFVAGRKYKISFDILDLSAGSARLGFQNQAGSALYGSYGTYALGSQEEIFTCLVDGTALRVSAHTASGSSFSIDNLSIVEWDGEINKDAEIDNSTLWLTNGSWSVSGGKASYDALADIRYVAPTVQENFVAGEKYQVIFKISNVQSGKKAKITFTNGAGLGWGTPATPFSSGTEYDAGTYIDTVTITNAGTVRFYAYNNGNGGTFDLELLSFKKITGLVAAYNMIPSRGGVLTDISGYGSNLSLVNNCLQTNEGIIFKGDNANAAGGYAYINDAIVTAFPFTVVGRFKTTGSSRTIFSIVDKSENNVYYYVGLVSNKLRINSRNTTNYFTESTNDYNDGKWHDFVAIFASNTSKTLYVDGGTETLSVTDSSTLSAGIDRFAIGAIYNTLNLFSGVGEESDLKIYNYAFTKQQAKDYHNSFAKRVKLIDHFQDAAVGQSMPREWKKGTGTYAIAEMATQDAVLKELDAGTKYLQCSVAGTIAIPSKSAYGEWEFAWYKGAEDNSFVAYFIADNTNATPDPSYRLDILNTESVRLLERSGGFVVLFATAAAYIANLTWYKIKIMRTLDGEFTVYIKGGAFGDTYTLTATNPPGNNPVTDNTNKTSEYFILELDSGDRIALINIKEGVEQ